ncbi:signal peptidase complex subunit 2 [Ostreococcus tauri]|uniref:Signal peptidase complex subunit 2 n=1 Tax=Ostreococcus tauri TaxID=70448 RepID=A0A1Y5IMI5_OSTTA|nr:signal peptidase complex subunit 2 [Ostreococcus tauri]
MRDDDAAPPRVEDVRDHGAIRRAYDDATARAIVEIGYDEDHRAVDARIAIHALALVIAACAHVAWTSTPSRAVRWMLTAAYAACAAAPRVIARVMDGDALMLTEARGETSTTRRDVERRRSRGLAVNVKGEKYAETLELIVTAKGDARWTNADAARVDFRVGEYVDADGEVFEEAYGRFVARAVAAYELGKGRGVDVDVGDVVAKMP